MREDPRGGALAHVELLGYFGDFGHELDGAGARAHDGHGAAAHDVEAPVSRPFA